MGNYRKINQDNLYLNGKMNDKSLDFFEYDEKCDYPFLACLYDGMGGLDSGELASLSAAKLSKLLYDKMISQDITQDDVYDHYLVANETLVNFKESHNVDFGTTAVICAFTDKNIIVSNMGDSRAFECKDGKLSLLSVDHNDSDLLSGVESSMSKGLSQYLGCNFLEFKIEPCINLLYNRYNKGDFFLLCSDGVFSSVSEEEILSAIKHIFKNPAKLIVEKAIANGSKDNATAIIVKFC